MVIVNVQIALAFNRQIKQSVAREQVEHVIEKADAGVDCARTAAVEIERDGDVGFFGFA